MTGKVTPEAALENTRSDSDVSPVLGSVTGPVAAVSFGDEIIAELSAKGPRTGSELMESLPHISPIVLWKRCFTDPGVLIQNCARYYLRYDVRRENMLRLSPSILRDFMTFSLVYLPSQRVEAVEAATRLANRFRAISLRKIALARRALLSLDTDARAAMDAHCAAFLSGDIAYFLAHDTLRRHPEMDTPIRGSDIDIVIVTNAEADPADIARIEDGLLVAKRRFLVEPDIREELDFIVKPVGRMIDQMGYGDIHEKIASKILYESYFLMGRVDLYDALMETLTLRGTRARIEADFETALSERKRTIAKIFDHESPEDTDDPEVKSLFYFSQERLEFQ